MRCGSPWEGLVEGVGDQGGGAVGVGSGQGRVAKMGKGGRGWVAGGLEKGGGGGRGGENGRGAGEGEWL